jgi:hypothetical protein
VRLNGQEDHAHALLVRDLHQQTRPVAGLTVTPTRAAMRELDQDLDAFLNNVVRRVAFDVGYEADTAGVVLVLRVIQSLSDRETMRQGGLVHFQCRDYRD